jgi:3-dehydroquinate synthase
VTETAPPDLKLRHSQGETALYLGLGALERSRGDLARWVEGRKVFVITSPAVAELAGKALEGLLGEAASVETLLVEEGESAKTLATAEELWEAMLARDGRRDSRVVGLGGGSVGDLAGFVAGAFLRGVEFALVPTTLLAQVDASIGGKTAIDLPAGKNTVGLFWFPSLVISDVGLLSSLPAGELQSGMVEVIKIGAADDIELFETLEEDLQSLLGGEPEGLAEVIRRAVEAKLRVVASDPRESGRRRLLNFGHTLGHAIETELGYSGLRHGEAVAYGMQFACQLARTRQANSDWLERLESLLDRLALPDLPALSREGLIDSLARDKKSTQAGLFWVLPVGPGRVEITSEVSPDTVRATLDDFLSR